MEFHSLSITEHNKTWDLVYFNENLNNILKYKPEADLVMKMTNFELYFFYKNVSIKYNIHSYECDMTTLQCVM